MSCKFNYYDTSISIHTSIWHNLNNNAIITVTKNEENKKKPENKCVFLPMHTLNTGRKMLLPRVSIHTFLLKNASNVFSYIEYNNRFTRKPKCAGCWPGT